MVACNLNVLVCDFLTIYSVFGLFCFWIIHQFSCGTSHGGSWHEIYLMTLVQYSLNDDLACIIELNLFVFALRL